MSPESASCIRFGLGKSVDHFGVWTKVDAQTGNKDLELEKVKYPQFLAIVTGSWGSFLYLSLGHLTLAPNLMTKKKAQTISS